MVEVSQDNKNVAAASRRSSQLKQAPAASRRSTNPEASAADNPGEIGYFDPGQTVSEIQGAFLPHWRQEAATYFVTFRLHDSLPQDKLQQWKHEKETWLKEHPEPHDAPTREDFYKRFPARMQQWLDQGHGSCLLRDPEVQSIVTQALRHFDGDRYALDEHVVAANHIHALVTPTEGHDLSNILHSWKSYTAHEIVNTQAYAENTATKVAAASRRSKRNTNTVWQKESFDHIVRSPQSLENFRQYIRAHREWKRD